jgi:hypothetical protein
LPLAQSLVVVQAVRHIPVAVSQPNGAQDVAVPPGGLVVSESLQMARVCVHSP